MDAPTTPRIEAGTGDRWATISPCGTYRYLLGRRWAQGARPLGFVMLNPSTADGGRDDPTIRRCRGFAERHGRTALMVANCYAWRATHPQDLVWAERDGNDIVGPANDVALWLLAGRCGDVVVAWGAHPFGKRRAAHVVEVLARSGAKVLCLGLTYGGQPRHPLYVPGATVPTEFQP